MIPSTQDLGMLNMSAKNKTEQAFKQKFTAPIPISQKNIKSRSYQLNIGNEFEPAITL
ncbi:MAG: hypothetical protein KKE44_23735 [Proteobacteria bacterium]|nr:hypothetical protein [Pseudomonadota bacterium]MBU1585745.1 hypothetical protein [Pseudomonadota bacterium]MBU2453333.1 hypothetical protein [Pseudomonadota bacterium]MBU2628358.1 hypothetical protein [Pseudomonadota bacterium]